MSVRSHKYSVVGVKLCASTPNFSSYIFKSFFSLQTQCMKKNEIYFLGSRRNFTKIQILSLFALMMLQTCKTFFLAFMKLFALQLNCMNSEWIKLQKNVSDVVHMNSEDFEYSIKSYWSFMVIFHHFLSAACTFCSISLLCFTAKTSSYGLGATWGR